MAREIDNFFENNKVLVNQATNTTFRLEKEGINQRFGMNKVVMSENSLFLRKKESISTSTDPIENNEIYNNSYYIDNNEKKLPNNEKQQEHNEKQENTKYIQEIPIENKEKSLNYNEKSLNYNEKSFNLIENPNPLNENPFKLPQSPINSKENQSFLSNRPLIKENSPIQKKTKKPEKNTYFMKNDFLDSLKKCPPQENTKNDQKIEKNDKGPENLKSSLTSIPKIKFDNMKIDTDSSEDVKIHNFIIFIVF